MKISGICGSKRFLKVSYFRQNWWKFDKKELKNAQKKRKCFVADRDLELHICDLIIAYNSTAELSTVDNSPTAMRITRKWL